NSTTLRPMKPTTRPSSSRNTPRHDASASPTVCSDAPLAAASASSETGAPFANIRSSASASACSLGSKSGAAAIKRSARRSIGSSSDICGPGDIRPPSGRGTPDSYQQIPDSYQQFLTSVSTDVYSPGMATIALDTAPFRLPDAPGEQDLLAKYFRALGDPTR